MNNGCFIAGKGSRSDPDRSAGPAQLIRGASAPGSDGRQGIETTEQPRPIRALLVASDV
ncbi:MAG: hypothetical protein ACX94C_11080 [Phycisphaerales bacterium]